MPQIYLDACRLNRPLDDRTQDRVRLESEAVLLILARIEVGEWQWLGSEVLELEIDRIPDRERRARVEMMSDAVGRSMLVEPVDVARAQELEVAGFHGFDALHLACAERGGADVFLTTDDRLLRRASRLAGRLRVRVENPLSWLKEMMTP